jgi:hypothetical protein
MSESRREPRRQDDLWWHRRPDPNAEPDAASPAPTEQQALSPPFPAPRGAKWELIPAGPGRNAEWRMVGGGDVPRRFAEEQQRRGLRRRGQSAMAQARERGRPQADWDTPPHPRCPTGRSSTTRAHGLADQSRKPRRLIWL